MNNSNKSVEIDIGLPPHSFEIDDKAILIKAQAGDSNATSPPSVTSSDSNNICDSDSSATSEHLEEVYQQASEQHRKIVRFSIVRTREYNVVDELEGDPNSAPRRSLGWEFTEQQIDLETHLSDSIKERHEKYYRLITEHILRAEREKAELEKIEKAKRKGWKARAKRLFNSLGRGVIEAAHKSSFVIVTTPY
jgi:hypothetical protein